MNLDGDGGGMPAGSYGLLFRELENAVFEWPGFQNVSHHVNQPRFPVE